MFENLIKKTKTYKNLKLKKDDQMEYDKQLVLSLKKQITYLTKEIEILKSPGPRVIDEGKSSVIFEIDNELNIVTKSEINKDVINTLIDNGYIKSEHSEDFAMIQLAFILIANEVTEQIIENVNDYENKLDI